MLYFVRLKSNRNNFRQPGSSVMTNVWTFKVEAPTPKAAGRLAVENAFGTRQIASLYLDGIDVWPADVPYYNSHYARIIENDLRLKGVSGA